MSKFHDVRMCEASMSHISYKDSVLLSNAADREAKQIFPDSVVVSEHAFGYFVYLDDELLTDGNGYKLDLIHDGYSTEFVKLLLDAKSAGFHWLKLDADCPQYDDRKIFEWA